MKKQPPLVAGVGRPAAKLRLFVFIGFFLIVGYAFGKPAGCPCSPCTCSPCHCGGGGGKSGSKHHGKDREHGDRASVGVGANVDLGGIGHRKAEADPFAVSGGGSTSTASHTREKTKTKRRDHDAVEINPFTDVNLTGAQAKGDTTPPGPINVSDPPAQTNPANADQAVTPS